jgi:hypothetical protein
VLGSQFYASKSATAPGPKPLKENFNMIRKAIIICSPGTKNSVNYLIGVDTDLHLFVNFLKSPIGGYWEDKLIAGLC